MPCTPSTASPAPNQPWWCLLCLPPTGSSLLSLIDPFACTSSYPFIGHRFTVMYMCANIPASSPLIFFGQMYLWPQVSPSWYSLPITLATFCTLTFIAQLPWSLINASDACSLLHLPPTYLLPNEHVEWNVVLRAYGWGSGTAPVLLFIAVTMSSPSPCTALEGSAEQCKMTTRVTALVFNCLRKSNQ